MASNIKGITIEINGDTTGLDKAIRKVKGETKGVDSELKQVNKSLKFNPNNTTLLAQKMTLLKQRVDATKKQINELKNYQRQMDAKGVDKNSEAYRRVQREIIEAESKLKHYEAEQMKVTAQASRVGQLGAKFKDVGSKATAVGNAMRGVSIAMASVATSIGALTIKSAKWADDIVTYSKVYGQSTDELQKYKAAAELVDVNAEAISKTHRKLERNMLNASLGSKKQAQAFEALGVEYKNADGSLREGDQVWQETIEALGKMTNETERDAYAMALMGRSATELNPLIMDGAEGYKLLTDAMAKNDLEFVDEKTLQRANDFNDRVDTIKALVLIALQNIGSKLAGSLVPLMDKLVSFAGTLANKLSNASPALLKFVGGLSALVAGIAPALLIFGHLSTALGTSFKQLALLMQKMPMLSRAFTILTGPIGIIVGALTLLFATNEKFRSAVIGLIKTLMTSLMPIVKIIEATIKQLVPVISTLITEVGNALTPVITALTPILTMVLNYVGKMLKTLTAIAIPVIKKVASVIKTLTPVLTKVATGVLSFVNKVGGAFKRLKNAIVHPIETAKNLIKALIDKIKGFFNFDVKMPNIPLPHFKITPKGWKMKDLLKGKIPHLSIDWHAQGGIFTRPTLLSTPDGSIHGVGERGAEAIIPLDKLWQHLDAMNGITINVYGSDNMNVNELAYAVEQRLIQMQKRKRMAWA